MKVDFPVLLTLMGILLALLGNIAVHLQGIARLEEALKFSGKRLDWHDDTLADHGRRIGDLEVGHGELRAVIQRGPHQHH